MAKIRHFWPKFGHLCSKFWHRQKLTDFWDCIQTAMNLPNFWYGSCSYGSFLENHTLHARKTLIWQFFCNSCQNLAFLPKFTVWEFLAYNFQTPLWMYLAFCMEVILMVFCVKFICQENHCFVKFWHLRPILRVGL